MEPIRASSARVYAVVVCFNPSQEDLGSLVAALVPQVEYVLLVDNGSNDTTHAWLKALCGPRTGLISNGANLGVAAAQNVGIRRALADGASHVALYDHDSLPAPDMIEVQLAVEEKILREDNHAGQGMPVRIAGLGPSCVDVKTGNQLPFMRLAGCRIFRQMPAPDVSHVYADYLISSGILLPAKALEEIGLMDESLFIDYVDIEWGWRARAKGYTCVGIPLARMAHRIGESSVKVPFLNRYLNIHSSRRHYFFYRNAIWLYRRGYVPFCWKVRDALRILVRTPFYFYKAADKAEELKCILGGIFSGLNLTVESRPKAISPYAD